MGPIKLNEPLKVKSLREKKKKCDCRRVSEMQCDKDSTLVACFEDEGRGPSTKECSGLWKLGIAFS